jgi:hypothetical protein
MSIICNLFGHKPLTVDGWSGGLGYARVAYTEIDGLGVVHYRLIAECPRCHEHYYICSVHEEKRKGAVTL